MNLRHPSRVALAALLFTAACISGSTTAVAQDLPTDALVQAAFGATYNHLGLMEYCAAKGFATAADVANTRKMVDAVTRGITVGAAARAQEAVGKGGIIVGEQIIGLMDSSNPARPEVVPAGRTMSLADNARAQKTSERVLCGQMADQVAPLPH